MTQKPHIAAHAFHPIIGREHLEKRWPRILANLTTEIHKHPDLIHNFAADDLGVALATVLGEREKACSLMRWRAYFIEAIFFLAHAKTKGAPAEIRHPEGGIILARTTGPANRADTGSWTDGALCAQIIRDGSVIEFLCSVPTSVMRKAPGVETPEYMYLMIDGLRAVFEDKANAALAIKAREAAARRRGIVPPKTEPEVMPSPDDGPELLMNALEAISRPDVIDRAWTEQIDEPFLVALLRWLVDGPAEFDKAMEEALIAHRTYWSSLGEDGAIDHTSMVPLRLIALAAIAHDAGHELPFTSDYLPDFLVRGDCRRGKAPR